MSPTVPAVDAAAQEELGERLALLTERLEAARVESHVPGMAVAVVKDGTVVFAKGFGHADLDAKRPATPDTMFAIGSSTKAFTSLLVGTFVDEGKLSWDDPIEKHLPEMKLAVRRTDQQPTLRDAMCHRTGFTRMGVLWAGGSATPEQMYATTSHAEPWADFGKSFLYNNVVYASAGEAAARVSGKPWAQLVQERILDPLHMDASNTSATLATSDPRRAQGYRYDDAADLFEPVPMRNLDLIGPAGAINSNVLDMTQWLRLQLGRGEIDGTRVISKAAIEATWTPQIEVGSGIKYALGWFVHDWKGHRVLEHGGNIDGYAAAVAFLPDDGIGYVLLTNVSGTPLQSSSREIVWSSMLDPLELPEESERSKPLDPKPYVGKFVANFGPWVDARMTVLSKGGKLYVDVPDQTVYELLPPDSDGKWKFAVTGQIAASFEALEDGKANVLRLHQGGLDFEMPREGWTPPAEIDLAAYTDHLGHYAATDGKTSATVVRRGNRIAIDIPGQMVYELHPPDADSKWRFRIKQDIAVSFERTAPKKGSTGVVALVMHQGGVDKRMLRKKAGPKVPTPAELDAIRKAAQREQAIAKLGLVEIRGTLKLSQSGVEGTVRVVFDATRVRTEIDFGTFGRVIDVDNGTRAWTEGTLSPVEESRGKYLEQVHQGHPLTLAGALVKRFTTVDVDSQIEVEGATRLRATLTRGALPPMQVLVDPKTGDVVQIDARRLLPGMGAIPVKTTLSGFREVLGLRVPFSVQTEDDPSGRTIMKFQSIEKSAADPAVVFPDAPPKD